MKGMKIVGYLMIIVALEGALHEYMRLTSERGDSMHHANRHGVSSNFKKESARVSMKRHAAWYETILMALQGLWALLIGLVQLIWGGIYKWIKLMLVVFECSELVQKLAERFNLWSVLR